LSKIEITGAVFDSPTTFDFFPSNVGNKIKSIKGALLFGRNGSGKSTIAKAFRKLSGQDIPTINNVTSYDVDNHPIILSEDEQKHIFVFDEDYVDKNVKIQQDHLDTILMLGPAADYTDKIDKAKSELDKAKSNFELQDAIYKEYIDSRNVKSPQYYLYRIAEALKGDDNWAGRDRKINGKRTNTQVRDDTYKAFISLNPSKTKNQLLSDFISKMKELDDARTGVSTIVRNVPSLPSLYSTFNDEDVIRILSEKIERPELSEREKK
jgi:energy-coupling factor transporter ATP-binding protein EcfA2